MPELSWSAGQDFPVVDGKTIFPTMAVSTSPETPPSYSTHWYAGSVYSKTSASVTWLYATIKTPAKNPKSDEFYYVLMSAWDNAGSYDQIGFADNWGYWGLTYSWTSGSCSSPTYHFSPGAMHLSLGTTYKFYITTAYHDGVVWFEAVVGSTIVWYLSANTGGTYLSMAYSYCGSYDYTDYVEVWYTHKSGGYPSFTFNFAKNQYSFQGNGASQWYPASWWVFKAGSVPSSVYVVITGQKVQIHK